MTSSPKGSQPHLLDLDPVSRLCRICGLHPKSKLHNHTPVPQFDEGQNYVNDLEREIRSEAVRALLADIDAALARRHEHALVMCRRHTDLVAMLYDRIAAEIDSIRREIAEMGGH